MKTIIALIAACVVIALVAVHLMRQPREEAFAGVATSTKAVSHKETKRLAYLVSDIRIPFWDIMNRGVIDAAQERGYAVEIHCAKNDRGEELAALARAIKGGVDGLVISPTSSSACVTLLKIAKRAGVPVVISDIGTDGGEYVSSICSNNFDGARDIGRVLCRELDRRGWKDASVGIVAIPQERKNGRARTAGFMNALEGTGIRGGGIWQQETWTEDETYGFCMELMKKNADMRAIWLQGSDQYRGALRAIADSGKKGDVLLVTFDAEPEFIGMIESGELVGSAMQQPFLMGQEAVRVLVEHLGGRTVQASIEVPIMAISKDNITDKLPLIRRNVLGMSAP